MEKINAFSVVSVNKIEKSSTRMFHLDKKKTMLPIFQNNSYDKKTGFKRTYILKWCYLCY